jgi:hypothetical protein
VDYASDERLIPWIISTQSLEYWCVEVKFGKARQQLGSETLLNLKSALNQPLQGFHTGFAIGADNKEQIQGL